MSANNEWINDGWIEGRKEGRKKEGREGGKGREEVGEGKRKGKGKEGGGLRDAEIREGGGEGKKAVGGGRDEFRGKHTEMLRVILWGNLFYLLYSYQSSKISPIKKITFIIYPLFIKILFKSV